MRKILYYLVLFAFMSNASLAEVIQINANELKQLMQSDVTIIDVRTPAEWKQTGLVDGSVPIMFFNEKRQPLTEQWLQQAAEIVTPQDELVLICRSGNRSNMIAHYLSKQHQFVRVYNVQNGIKDWLAKGNKTVKYE